MLIPTAGLLHDRQASMDVTVSLYCAHAAAAASRRACAGRVHAVHSDLRMMFSVCVCMTPVHVFASQSRAPQGRLKSPKFKSGLYTKFQNKGILMELNE